ncbi:hypothetical protein QFC22_005588 [Naganishia vaughanmartiniae]|uniref:Uncharacterized protein n=1 Tax=Naganishia vaughanmartiniae TaxID=1424756 RepID=A0ACC2WSU9_9TREE|nr:hypothetical protein QFC22_005588 [Naganishia vaughanmartiniae]
MLSIAAIDTAKKSNFDTGTGSLLVFFVSLFLAASTLGPGVAGWAYTGESGSSRLRAKTTTLGTVGNAIVGLIMTTVLPYLLSADYGAKWGAKTGYLFAGLGAVCIVLLWFFIPDFTGRSYAQLDELFLRKIPARKFASTECTGDYGRAVTAREVEEMAGVH